MDGYIRVPFPSVEWDVQAVLRLQKALDLAEDAMDQDCGKIHKVPGAVEGSDIHASCQVRRSGEYNLNLKVGTEFGNLGFEQCAFSQEETLTVYFRSEVGNSYNRCWYCHERDRIAGNGHGSFTTLRLTQGHVLLRSTT
jgi:hypothetical protein